MESASETLNENGNVNSRVVAAYSVWKEGSSLACNI